MYPWLAGRLSSFRELADETLIYDLATDQAYCLNLTAARVWKNCDGERTVAQLGELLKVDADAPVPDDIIWLALDQLEKI
ncbi:MAG: PqqD family peptide modification chaperone [Pyrinomonadaceae bacterium]|nr:PqqD family peptide modification chaperone [Pyrinomonadaceae bacterium]